MSVNSKTLDTVEKANAWVISKVNCCLSKHVSQRELHKIYMHACGRSFYNPDENSRKHLV